MATVLSLGIIGAASFTLIPHSVRLYMAAIAHCDGRDEALAASADPVFTGVKLWERPLALLYRVKYWNLGGPTAVEDSVSVRSSVFHILVLAAEGTGGACDAEVLALMRRYLDGSRPLDEYDSTGYTALHSAIIFQQTDLVRALLDAGADRSMPVRSGDDRVEGMNAIELAHWFENQDHSPASASGIAELLANR